MFGHSQMGTGNPTNPDDGTILQSRKRSKSMSDVRSDTMTLADTLLLNSPQQDVLSRTSQRRMSMSGVRQDMPTPDIPEETQPAPQTTTRELGYMDNKRKEKMEAHLAEADRLNTLAQSETNEAERLKLLKKKEAEQVEANTYKKRLKISQIEDATEQSRELSTFRRHGVFDSLKKIFYKPSQFAHEEAQYEKPAEGQMPARRFKNIGRAFFGGTKPMYRFQEEGGDEFLYKEAVNCVGMEKTSGAIVTEAASKLQRRICGDDNFIEAFTVKDATGKVVGSLQRKIEQLPEDQRFDLFSWQAHPESTPLPEGLKKEILREHTLDWLLCNFDTKGENFLHQSLTDGKQLCSFDKEASFSYLSDERAQHMSTDYKPHSNDTLYNVVFTQFAEGKLDLNLQDAITAIERAVAIPDDEYLAGFESMLQERYKEQAERDAARAKILERKTGLVNEYRTFFTQLLERRRAAMSEKNIPFDHEADLVDGTFKFQNTQLVQEDLAQQQEPEEEQIQISDVQSVEMHLRRDYRGFGTTPDPSQAGKINKDRLPGQFTMTQILSGQTSAKITNPDADGIGARLNQEFNLSIAAHDSSGDLTLTGLTLGRNVLIMMGYAGEGMTEEQLRKLYSDLTAPDRLTETTQEAKDAADQQFVRGINSLKQLYYIQLKRLEATYGTMIVQMHPADFLRQIGDASEYKAQFAFMQDVQIMLDKLKDDPRFFDPQNNPMDEEFIRLGNFYSHANLMLTQYGMASFGVESKIANGMEPDDSDFAAVRDTQREWKQASDIGGIGGPHMDEKQRKKYITGVRSRMEKDGLSEGLFGDFAVKKKTGKVQ